MVFLRGLLIIRKLPPNFVDLSDDEKRIVEESIYRLQLIHKHGYCVGEYEKISIINKIDEKLKEMEDD